MRRYVARTDDDRRKFWKEVDDYPDASPPAAVMHSLKAALPEGASILRFASRVRGGGSLGRPRFIAIAEWRGGRVVREAKALVPSAWNWAHGESSARFRFLDLATGKFRSPDPFLSVKDRFVVRRIAADSQKVELGKDAGAELKIGLLRAMGFDLGAIHAAQRQAAEQIVSDLDVRPSDWLYDAAKKAAAAVKQDFAEWTR